MIFVWWRVVERTADRRGHQAKNPDGALVGNDCIIVQESGLQGLQFRRQPSELRPDVLDDDLGPFVPDLAKDGFQIRPMIVEIPLPFSEVSAFAPRENRV